MKVRTLREAILQSLEDIGVITTYMDVYKHIVKKKYYDFKDAKTPTATVSAQLGRFVRKGDTRVKRIIQAGETYSYYLTKNEKNIGIDVITAAAETGERKTQKRKTYEERDLHKLLSTYLKSTSIYSKTIFHEQSLNSKDNHQKWVHPDMVGINFLKLESQVSESFLKAINKGNAFKLISYELKKEINSDYELKKHFFQAVSNSSWANYGYLIAFEISPSLNEEMKRLNQSFGIGIIQLTPMPYESKILYPAKYKDLDFTTIDKLCKINKSFEKFIEQAEKLMTAPLSYRVSIERELDEFCDSYFSSEAEITKYCFEKHIPTENESEESE